MGARADSTAGAEHAGRKRRYLAIVGVRVLCLALACVLLATWWLVPVLVLLAVALPWVAVLVADDRLAPLTAAGRAPGHG